MDRMTATALCLLLLLSLSWGQNLPSDMTSCDPPGETRSCDLPDNGTSFESPSSRRSSCDHCDMDLKCDCSGSGLTAVPTVTDQALSLDLAFNNITEVHRADLSGHQRLKVLSLRANRLSRIDPRAFFSLWNLEELDLSQNNLTSLNHQWFSKLGALQRLRLHSNRYRCLGSPPPFQTLFRLQTLSFGGEFLEEIRDSDLKGLGGLDQLYVEADNLKRYESGSLSHLWPLGHVTLSLRSPFLWNQTLASAVIQDVSYPETPLTLENVDLSNSRSVKPLQTVAAKRVRNLSMKNLVLTDETIVDVLNATNASTLSTMTINNLILKGVGRWEKGNRTEHSNMDECFIKDAVILNNFFFTSFLSLGYLLKYPRKISVINANVFLMPCPTSSLFENLQYLDLSENLLTDLTLAETLCHGTGKLHDIRVLNFSANALKSLSLVSRLVTRLSKLTHLDVSRNGFSLMPQSCPWPPFLRFLNISRAKFTSVSSCLPTSLQVLDLSYNDLEAFFLVLPALRELYLSGNKFLRLPPGWFFPNLQTLKIQSNTLNLFSRSDLLSFARLQNFEAGRNKFVCSCGFVSFFHALASGDTGVVLTDGQDSYTCDSPLFLQGKPVALVQRSVAECHHVLFVSVSCGLALLVMVVLSAVLWRVHAFWYLKMTLVWLKAKRSSRGRQWNPESELLVSFDAFVSYSERDAGWVENYLVPELEQARSSSEADPSASSSPSFEPLKLCLHKRDFLPGRWIMDNIIHAIECSRKTVFVLSENFVQSDWCRYELDFTHFQLFEGNSQEDAAILVLLEPLAKDDVPKRFCKLRKLMSSTTYLEWPQDQDQRDHFWTSLRLALRPNQDQDQDLY